MNNTVRDIVQAFRDWFGEKTSQQSQSSAWSSRLIYHFLLYYRATALYQKLKSGDDINPDTKHILPCIPLIAVDQAECPCAPLSGCKFKKTKYPIPRHLKIFSVASIDGTISYDYVEWRDFKDKLNHRIEAMRKAPYYTFKKINDEVWLYLHNSNHKRQVTVDIIPYDPVDIMKFPDCDGNVNKCKSPLDCTFSMDSELQSLIFERTASTLISGKLNAESDYFNNTVKDANGLTLK
jgi:hypothetical protein